MLEEMDKYISSLSESVARSMDRRQILKKGIKGVFAATAGMALGQFANIKNAFAVTCTCNWAGGSGNANCPKSSGCPLGSSAGCPTGYSVCTSSSGCGTICNWPGGRWVSCTGLGTHGHGYKLCTDCNNSGCADVCTCLSGIICYNCSTQKEVEEEMRRLGVVYAH
jgi:hypothetical protein